MLHFGQKLKLQRERFGLNLETLAKETGVSYPELVQAEETNAFLSEEALKALSAFTPLGLPLQTLRSWQAMETMGPERFQELLHRLTLMNTEEQARFLQNALPDHAERAAVLQAILTDDAP